MVSLTIPLAVEALTPEWLTEALHTSIAEQLGEAQVANVQSESIGRGAGILCQLFRLTLDYDRPAPRAPRTVIAKFASTEPQTRGMVALFRFYEREARFYKELASQMPMGVPRCHFGSFDAASGDFILLLEDLAGMPIGDQLGGASTAQVTTIVDSIAQLHVGWWRSPRVDALDWVPPINDQVNKLGLGLYPAAWGPFIERFGSTLPTDVLRTGERLGQQINDTLDRLAEKPRTLCHGDLRLDNIFFGGTDGTKIRLIDWQIAVRATGTYDIGYFMSQSVQPETRRACERDVLARYHRTLVAGGVQDYSLEQCLEDYRWALLFCFVYPVMGGGLGDLANERGFALARAMAERSAAAIIDWHAGDLLDS